MNKNMLFKVLLKPEFNSLSGKNYVHIITLFCIYIFAIFCIGSSSGILHYLDDKMDNAYVNMVEAEINNTIVDLDILNKCMTDSVQKIHELESYNTFGIRNVSFSKDHQSDSPEDFKVLRVGIIESTDHPLWSMLIDTKSDLKPTSSLVQEIKYSGEKTSVYLTNEIYLFFFDDTYQNMEVCWNKRPLKGSPNKFLPIGGVVEQLPFKLDAIMFKDCYDWLNGASDSYTNWGTSYTEMQYVSDLSILPKSLINKAKPIFFNSGVILNIPYSLKKKIKFETINIHTIQDSYKVSSKDEHLCFSFTDLNQVEVFSAYLKENHSCYTEGNEDGIIEIDLTTIETKKYLNIFNQFGEKLSLALVLVSIILIINYSIAILTLHISRNKRNLGTLLAFGFNNTKVVSFYVIISALMILISFITAYLLNYLLANEILQLFIKELNFPVSRDVIQFVNPSIYYVIGFLIVPLIIIALKIFNLLKTSPGDLIYNR